MELNVTIELWQKGRYYVAKCPELDFISQGRTTAEAKQNLLEVIDIQFEEMAEIGTLEDYLTECGYIRREQRFIPQVSMLGVERYAVEVV